MTQAESEIYVFQAGWGRTPRPNRYSRPALWILCGILTFITVASMIGWLAGTTKGGAFQAFFYVPLALLFGRAAVAGFEVKNGGILVRSILSTRRWRWDEIESFWLRGTVYSPNLRMRLKDGREHGIYGLAARTAGEKQRAEKICTELNRRLQFERGEPRASGGSWGS